MQINLDRVRLGSILNKNNWNNTRKRLFGRFSHSGILGFPFRLLCSQEQSSRNIFPGIYSYAVSDPISKNCHYLKLSQARFIRRISAVSNAIETIDNEMICFIIYCLNCIRHGRNATYERGLSYFCRTLQFQNIFWYSFFKIKQISAQYCSCLL